MEQNKEEPEPGAPKYAQGALVMVPPSRLVLKVCGQVLNLRSGAWGYLLRDPRSDALLGPFAEDLLLPEEHG